MEGAGPGVEAMVVLELLPLEKPESLVLRTALQRREPLAALAPFLRPVLALRWRRGRVAAAVRFLEVDMFFQVVVLVVIIGRQLF